MPRLFNEEFTQVRPRTDILRYGVSRDKTKEVWPMVNTEGDVQNEPYFLNEEEVSRSGIQVKSSFQRARWYNGTIHNWYGRRKNTGRGEAGSGLKYDIAKPVKK